ncbi:hypothetical protein BD410DRAFT_795592 [Rickenella mellea]|uniref:Protein kinase domain-containing protein n=1 Tax=Rickenella mellea TaxID=50990 RepID=A0A4Y7PMF2_9AGAM|nr:hypothetical protein BD410DRAFT_795592 [Rickenella mellea]
MNVPSYYTPNSELVLDLKEGGRLKVKVVKVFTPFLRCQVSLVKVTEDLADLPSTFIIKTFDPRFDGVRFMHEGADENPWSREAEAEAEALRRRGTPRRPQRDYELPEDDDVVAWEQFCYERMDCAYSVEVEAYQRLRSLQGVHIPTFYGEAKLLTTDVKRAIIPRALLVQYIPNLLPIDKISKDLITPTLAKSFLNLLKTFHAHGVIQNNVNGAHANLVVSRSETGETRAFVVYFGSAVVRGDETEEEWWNIVFHLADTKFTLRQLKKCLGTEDMQSFIGEPIEEYA